MLGELFLLLCATVNFALGQGSCDFYQELQPKQDYFIYSPGYPQKYRPGASCQWYAVAPEGYQVFLVCETVNIPQSPGCWDNSLSLSLTGDPDLRDGKRFCGNQGFSEVSAGRRMNINLSSSPYSAGGSFLCSIGVQETAKPQPECNCGWKNTLRIVGGRDTGVNEYPMMAGLIDAAQRELFCDATIISNLYALTAAHCLLGKRENRIGLLVGDHDISTGNDTNSAQLIVIDKFISHPQYNSVTQVNDIALVRVNRPIEFNLRVGPACLPFNNVRDNFYGQKVTALGWGALEFGGGTSNTLKKVNLNVISLDQCKTTYGDLVSNNQMCTYTPNKDACQSDSGGPLLWQDPSNRVIKLLGTISYGIQCATDKPSVNTRVTQYLSWIMDNADDEFCVK